MSWQRHPRLVNNVTETAAPAATLKVAFASADRVHVDQHFGAACAFVIYAVGPERAGVVEVVQLQPNPEHDHDDKLAARLERLAGCAAVYCQAVGGSAIRRLLARGIQPIRVEDGTRIEHLLHKLKSELRAGSSAWPGGTLKRRASDTGRFDAMEAQGWQD